MKRDHLNSYGTWVVTTEGDVEGRTITYLGTYTGHIDEIALFLAEKCYYSLMFKPVEEVKQYVPSKPKVSIVLDIPGIYSMSSDNILDYMNSVFKGREVNVSQGSYYKSVVISLSESRSKELAREKALSKLTKEEISLLGIER